MPKCLSVLCFLGLSDVLWTALFRHVFVSLTLEHLFGACIECLSLDITPMLLENSGGVSVSIARWGIGSYHIYPEARLSFKEVQGPPSQACVVNPAVLDI